MGNLSASKEWYCAGWDYTVIGYHALELQNISNYYFHTQLLFVLAIRAAGDDETPLNFLVPKSRSRYRPCAGHPKR
jgi:hypothetical protein